MLETTIQSPTEVSPVYVRRKRKLPRNRSEQKSQGQINLQLYLEKMNEPENIQQNITLTTENDPNVITVTDKNSNTDLIRTERIENTN